ACVYRKLDPAIVVMTAAEETHREGAGAGRRCQVGADSNFPYRVLWTGAGVGSAMKRLGAQFYGLRRNTSFLPTGRKNGAGAVGRKQSEPASRICTGR